MKDAARSPARATTATAPKRGTPRARRRAPRRRYIPSGAWVHLSARTLQGRYAFVPRDELWTRRVWGLVGVAQARYDVELCAFHLMSNHYHALVRGRTRAAVSQFAQYLEAGLARLSHEYHGTHGTVFDGRFRSTTLLDDESALWWLRYILAHGTKEGLVANPKAWPGPQSATALADGVPVVGLRLDRPAYHQASRARAKDQVKADRIKAAAARTKGKPAGDEARLGRGKERETRRGPAESERRGGRVQRNEATDSQGTASPAGVHHDAESNVEMGPPEGGQGKAKRARGKTKRAQGKAKRAREPAKRAREPAKRSGDKTKITTGDTKRDAAEAKPDLVKAGRDLVKTCPDVGETKRALDTSNRAIEASKQDDDQTKRKRGQGKQKAAYDLATPEDLGVRKADFMKEVPVRFTPLDAWARDPAGWRRTCEDLVTSIVVEHALSSFLGAERAAAMAADFVPTATKRSRARVFDARGPKAVELLREARASRRLAVEASEAALIRMVQAGRRAAGGLPDGISWPALIADALAAPWRDLPGGRENGAPPEAVGDF